MSGKELFEAMSQVDDRFVEEAETVAVRKKPAWVKGCVAACAGLVACAVVFFGSGPVFEVDRVGNSAPESVLTNTSVDKSEYSHLMDQFQATGAATERPPQVELETPLLPQQAVTQLLGGVPVSLFCTDGNGVLLGNPRTLVITDRAELARYLAEQRAVAGEDKVNILEETWNVYDDAYFQKNSLLLVCLEGEGVTQYTVTDLTYTGEQWQMTVREESRADGGNEIVRWHLAAELHQSKLRGENQTAQVVIVDETAE